MRTFDDIEKEYLEAKKVSDSIRKELDKALAKTNSLYGEMKQFKLDNGMYHPMSDLKQYAGKIVCSIDLVKKNNDGTLETKCIYNDEIFEVDEHGHLDYSSYYDGVMYYDESENMYVYRNHDAIETKYNFVGYISIEIDSEDEWEV